MYVNFFSNGSVVDTVDTTKLAPVKVVSGGPYNTPITTDPALWGGFKTAGQYQYENAAAGQVYVAWQSPSNFIARMWPMDDAAAADLLIGTTIPTALGASTASITVISDGELYSS